MTPTLVLMAAGLATRFGGPKQLMPVGPAGEALLDYTLFDAARAGFRHVVFVVGPAIADAIAAHAAEWYGTGISITLAEQRLDDLPVGAGVPAGRSKPWGTAHAVFAARVALRGGGAFAACNADDYYGAAAFRALADHLGSSPDGALVGYRLDQTLSPHGGVSRAVCEADAAGWLRRVVEATEVRREHGTVAGLVDRERRPFPGDAAASMNLWGFPAAVPDALGEMLRGFCSRIEDDPSAEFLLSAAVNALVATKRLRVRVLPTPDRWFGMTFAQDLPAVRARLAELVRAGAYPPDLRAGFSGL